MIFLRVLAIVKLAISGFLILSLASACQANSIDNGVTKITIWHGINPPENRDIFNALVTKFNQTHLDIQVEGLYVGQSDQQLPKILTAVVGKQPPDLLWYTTQITGQLVELGAIYPLDNWFNQSPLKAEIEPAMFETMEFNQQIWSIPFATNNTAIFYRPSLFAEAGINKLPETWEQFRDVAKKLTLDKNNDGRIDQYGALLSLGKGEWNVFVWLPFIFSAGGEIVEGNKPNLVNVGTIKALQLGSDLVKDNLAILSAPERGYELDNFLAGKVAMQVTGPWTLGQLQQTNVDYSAFPIPVISQPAAVVGGENLFVFKTSPERQKAAIKFLEYVLSEEFQIEWALKTGYLPINIKAKNSPEYRAFVADNPVVEVFLKQMNWARSRPMIPGYTNLSENLGRAIEASLLGKKSPEEALKESQHRLDLSFNP